MLVLPEEDSIDTEENCCRNPKYSNGDFDLLRNVNVDGESDDDRSRRSRHHRLNFSDDNLLYTSNIDEQNHLPRTNFYKRVKSVGFDVVSYFL